MGAGWGLMYRSTQKPCVTGALPWLRIVTWALLAATAIPLTTRSGPLETNARATSGRKSACGALDTLATLLSLLGSPTPTGTVTVAVLVMLTAAATVLRKV
mgnify:CR=1 FL=1